MLVRKEAKHAYIIGTEDHENVTVVESICADGGALRPHIIFKGERITANLRPDVHTFKADIAVSPKGWTDGELAVIWLKKTFLPQIQNRRSPGEDILLLVDGHNSHTSLKFIEIAQQNRIELFAFVPHTTHVCQPLDIGIFGPNKTYFSQAVAEVCRQRLGGAITRRDFYEVYGNAHTKLMTKENILSAFKRAGMQYQLNGHVTDF